MTKLEQQIYEAMMYNGSTFTEMAKEAAKIALGLAEKAYEQGQSDEYYSEGSFKQFIQDYTGE